MQIYTEHDQTFITQLVCLYYRCDIPCEWAWLSEKMLFSGRPGGRGPGTSVPDGNFNRQHLWTIFSFACLRLFTLRKIEVVMHIFQIYLWLLHSGRCQIAATGTRHDHLPSDMSQIPILSDLTRDCKAGTFLRKDLWGWSQRVRTEN